MDWTLALTRNRDALLGVIATLFAMAGLVRGGTVSVLPRAVRLTILRALRPAESALRRLLLVEAQGLDIAPPTPRSAPSKPIPRGNGSERLPSFPLFDPRKRLGASARRHPAGPGPRLSFFDGLDPAIEPEAPPLLPDDPVSADRLCRRLHMMQLALENLPKQARRMARAMARRAAAAHREAAAKRPVSPIRPGRPPGYRASVRHVVDEILAECHQLALMARAAPDTS